MRLDDFDFAGVSDAARRRWSTRCARAGRAGCARRAGARTSARLTCAMSGRATRSRSPLPNRALTRPIRRRCARKFEADYSVLFERPIPGAAIEVLSWSVLVDHGCAAIRSVVAAVATQRRRHRIGSRTFFDGRAGERDRDPALSPRGHGAGRDALPGPAVIAEDETSTFVSDSFDAHIDGAGMHRHGTEGGLIMSKANGASLIDLQIMWNRLIAVVEEQAQVLLRTAFSPIVRECGDLSAGVFDRQGRMLAQAVTGTPGHVNSMAESVKHFIRHFPLETMKPGDAYITNDPWMGTGHLNDFVVTTPCFNGRQAGRAVLLHQPPDGHRRHRLRAGRHRRVHGGALHPDAQADRSGRRQRDADGDDPRQHAAADRHRRRHLFAGRLQRRRRASAWSR